MIAADMYNDSINTQDGYYNATQCENVTDYLCNNRSHTQENEFNEELINNCRYYIEGIALTPISVFGMLGKLPLNLLSKGIPKNHQ